jgi:hypothetical protein
MKNRLDREKREDQPIKNGFASIHLHQDHFYLKQRDNLDKYRAILNPNSKNERMMMTDLKASLICFAWMARTMVQR